MVDGRIKDWPPRFNRPEIEFENGGAINNFKISRVGRSAEGKKVEDMYIILSRFLPGC